LHFLQDADMHADPEDSVFRLVLFNLAVQAHEPNCGQEQAPRAGEEAAARFHAGIR
jgi:hypothetical protein